MKTITAVVIALLAGSFMLPAQLPNPLNLPDPLGISKSNPGDRGPSPSRQEQWPVEGHRRYVRRYQEQWPEESQRRYEWRYQEQWPEEGQRRFEMHYWRKHHHRPY